MPPAPKPTALKALAGNPGKRPLNRDEPLPTASTVEPPDGLPDAALAIWRALAPELVAVGCLTIIDRGELAKACRYEALTLDLLTAAEADVGKNKGRKMAPALWAAIKAGAKASEIFGRFGITPSERSRIHVRPRDDHDDPITARRKAILGPPRRA